MVKLPEFDPNLHERNWIEPGWPPIYRPRRKPPTRYSAIDNRDASSPVNEQHGLGCNTRYALGDAPKK